ncbi:TonB-dependent receptor [Sphingomonas colocasiae]|uniref:TonB-dependent receptor n=1 Tax=Sphingomonas colocasiae TaxID=1848973 RepID=A0ABS7PVF1_9SPHN|nr:TonB-dependent receptor [Sphingomonas colocasiae]MBY8824929.1 TonB-dependent receptor [Sphingomonas colocasiae]
MRRAFTGASLAALLAGLSTPALAQNIDAADAGDEIVVTAQKRSERLIDVPAAVTALGAGDLIAQGAQRFEDYQAQIPGLSTTQVAPGYSQINIRGINTGANQLSSTVSTYFGEVPTNSSTSAAVGNRLTPDPDLLDIARIEVLRGPQGTLYGANALGGVLKYVFVEPELQAVRGQAQFGATTVAHGGTGYVARAAIGAPIVQDRLGVRVSGFIGRDPGFIDNVALGRRNVNRSTNRGGRIALLWKPSDTLTINASSVYQKRDNGGLPQETVMRDTLAPTRGAYRQASFNDEVIDTEYQLHSLVAELDLGFADLVSVTSHGRQKTRISLDYSDNLGTLLVSLGIPTPIVALPVDNDVRKFTQEVRLASPTGGVVDYVLGGYYTRERSSSLNEAFGYVSPGVLAPAPFNPLQTVDLRNRYRETALFANATLNLGERFNIQAGGRWSRNRQHSSEPLEGLLFGPLSGTVFTNSSRESAWTFAVSPQFKVTTDWNLYARIAKGFRPGGANLVLPGGGAPLTYGSDTLINYEAGTKASLFDRRLNLSIAAFAIDWKDIQTTAKDAVGFNYLINGGKARSRGIEMEARWSADGLTLAGNLSYTDTSLRDPIVAVGAQRGDRLPYSPRWAGALIADYVLETGGPLKPSIGAGLRYTGTRQAYYSLATAGNPGDLKLPGYMLVDLRAGLAFDRYQASLFVSNLTDKRAILSATTESANPLTGDGARAAIARPRTIGLLLGVNF